MRAFFFTNMYLSPIQHGIQSAHCLAEIYNMHVVHPSLDEVSFNYVTNWAESHKTIIVFNGGTGDDLRELCIFFEDNANTFPWANFREPSLENAMTCVGIILPERIYGAVNQIQHGITPLAFLERTKFASGPEGENWVYTDWEVELIKKLTEQHLAR